MRYHTSHLVTPPYTTTMQGSPTVCLSWPSSTLCSSRGGGWAPSVYSTSSWISFVSPPYSSSIHLGGPSREGGLKSESKLFLRPIVDFAPPAARELLLLKTLHLLKFFPTYSAFYPPSCCQQTRGDGNLGWPPKILFFSHWELQDIWGERLVWTSLKCFFPRNKTLILMLDWC